MAVQVPSRHLFIDGEWREPVLKKRIPIINPATEQIIGDIPAATSEDVDLAVAAARRALSRNKGKDWASASGAVRAKYLRAIASKVLRNLIILDKMSSPSKRREMDVMKLMMSDYNVETINDGLNEFNVEFHGPKESLYEGGVWKIRVELPDAYPYKSPSIRFVNKIFHPNVDETSGSVCLDVINQSWSPMFDLLNIFEVFLPQLLLYPNPSDPLNGDAASLMMKDRKQYDQKVKEFCERYAKKENVTKGTADEETDDDEDVTDEETGSSDDEISGHADP